MDDPARAGAGDVEQRGDPVDDLLESRPGLGIGRGERRVVIHGNAALANLDALSNFETIGDSLSISANASLPTSSGFA